MEYTFQPSRKILPHDSVFWAENINLDYKIALVWAVICTKLLQAEKADFKKDGLVRVDKETAWEMNPGRVFYPFL